MTNKTLGEAVSAFGKSTTAKLNNPAIIGAPEDQLRGPLEALMADLAGIVGHADSAVKLVGETTLSESRTRPDYAVTVRNAQVGFIEVKAPGKGANPAKFSGPHDKRQWERLKSLPNLLYTDGNSFSLWQDGERVGDIVRLNGDVETSGSALAAPMSLVALVGDFLNWKPIAPKTPRQLAEISARLCEEGSIMPHRQRLGKRLPGGLVTMRALVHHQGGVLGWNEVRASGLCIMSGAARATTAFVQPRDLHHEAQRDGELDWLTDRWQWHAGHHERGSFGPALYVQRALCR